MSVRISRVYFFELLLIFSVYSLHKRPCLGYKTLEKGRRFDKTKKMTPSEVLWRFSSREDTTRWKGGRIFSG